MAPLQTCPTCAHLDAHTRTCKAIGAALTRWRAWWKPLGEMPGEGVPDCPGWLASEAASEALGHKPHAR